MRRCRGDGALGFWAAAKEILPETLVQRCRVHKVANTLNYLPKSVQPKAKAAMQEIWMAETVGTTHLVSTRLPQWKPIKSNGWDG